MLKVKEKEEKSRGGKEEKRTLEHSRDLLNWFSVCVYAPVSYCQQKLMF